MQHEQPATGDGAGQYSLLSVSLLPELLARIAGPPPVLVVALSGGVDSVALLLLAVEAREAGLACTVRAVHVNHGLHADAGLWQRHCHDLCRQLSLPLQALSVDASPAPGESPEDAARRARYAALRSQLDVGEVLLTAHHEDDQAETVLLALLRGSGPPGLAAMPASTAFGSGHMLRPLLRLGRERLRAYCVRHRVDWVEDPANRDTRYERSYLRHRVAPLLRERWPAFARTLSRVAAHQAEASELLAQLAAVDLRALGAQGSASLPADGLCRLEPARLANLLRGWLGSLGLPLPSTAQLRSVVDSLLRARCDAQPMVCWPGVEIRRHGGRVYAMAPLPAPGPAVSLWPDPRQPLQLWHGVLSTRPVAGEGLSGALASAGLQVRLRSGGERIRPAGWRHHHVLKKLLQATGVPPWERQRLPLLFVDGELAAVADLWVVEGFTPKAGEPGLVPVWQPAGPPAGPRRP